MGCIFYPIEYFFSLKKANLKLQIKENFKDLAWRGVESFVSPILNNFILIVVLYLLQKQNFIKTGVAVDTDLYKKYFFELFILIFLFKELLIYLLHLAMHRTILWKLHIVHHSTQNLNWLSADRVHVLESVMQYSLIGLFLFALSVPIQMIQIITIIEVFFNYALHSNIKFFNFKIPFLNSPHLHQWHHAKEQVYKGGQNFGSITVIWDIIFNTYHNPKDILPDIGLTAEAQFPNVFYKQLIYPVNIDSFFAKKKTGRQD
jgi:sterol desaturase/sphingolipid hydroxylase (fatty acid hydroxylase superfamily)